MSISDSARKRARIARLKALESEERVQNYGDLADSRVTVINYDPDRGYLVRALNGEIGYATNISGTQLGVGATVQATRKGNGFIIDYFDKSSGKGNDSDSNDLAKKAFGDTSTSSSWSPVWIGFGGVDPSTSTVGYKPDGQGGCDVKTYPKDKKLPEGVYATAKECQDSQKEGSFTCVSGKGCVEVTDGSGKYKTKAECEAALVPVNFTGGQCSTIYTVAITATNISGSVSNYTNIYAGPIRDVSTRINEYGVLLAYIEHAGGRNDLITLGGVQSDWTLSVTITRNDGQPDNCGNPPKKCP